MNWEVSKRAQVADELSGLAAAGLERSLRTVSSRQLARLVIQGREVANFSSNNYLGLAADERLQEAAIYAVERWGCGSGASRLIVGNSVLHEQLEAQLSSFHRAEAALLFNSGYHANVGVIPALVGRGDVVFSDELNHASIIDGCRLSRAEVVVFPHKQCGVLERLIREDARTRETHARRLIVSDSVFSMDGDVAPVVELVRIARAHRAWLMLDEAHAIGVLGEHGGGLAAALGVATQVDVRVGTLGKAVGSFGGYVVGTGALRQLLLQRARSFVFTTALPPAVVAANIRGVELVGGAEGDALRARLWRNIHRLAEGLESLGLVTETAESAVVPIVIGDAQRTMAASEALLELGVYAQGIRPPTVPRGTSRLRVAVMATHLPGDSDLLLSALETLRARKLV